MLRIHSRMPSTATQHVVRYKDNALECNAPSEQWIVLRDAEGPLTCLLAHSLSLVHAAVRDSACIYEVLPREQDKSAIDFRPHQIRVTGNVTAHIYWEHAGEVQLIVESGAKVYFYSRNGRAQVVASIRNRGQAALGGKFWAITPEVDTYSRLDVSRARCAKPIRLGFRGVLTPPLSFPHAESDCRRVDDDTPAEQECGACCERVKNAVFSPCGHDYMCLVCADRYQRTAVLDFTCPLCRAPITAVAPR